MRISNFVWLKPNTPYVPPVTVNSIISLYTDGTELYAIGNATDSTYTVVSCLFLYNPTTKALTLLHFLYPKDNSTSARLMTYYNGEFLVSSSGVGIANGSLLNFNRGTVVSAVEIGLTERYAQSFLVSSIDGASKLYMGTYVSAEILKYNGSALGVVTGDGGTNYCDAIVEYSGKLYFTTSSDNTNNGYCGVSTNGTDFSGRLLTATADGRTGTTGYRGLAVYNGELYIGEKMNTSGNYHPRLYKYNGSSTSVVFDFDTLSRGSEIANLAVFNGELYIGLTERIVSNKVAVYKYNGSNVSLVWESNANGIVRSMVAFVGSLFVVVNTLSFVQNFILEIKLDGSADVKMYDKINYNPDYN